MPEQYIEKETLQKIRDRLWERAKSINLTLEDLEDRTGFSYSQVYRIVRGKNNISVSGLVAICRALEIQPNQILDFEIEIPNFLPPRKARKGI
ncbi:helix-turn-helix domain-containing protein [Sphingobacterium humi]|uniref:Helix-turn-helix domain-containing protein n=1 Tax=Sphingobacterium humi TaxID=1796905 RepID=A0A6N8L256_9SPHI|nr:helix-turn-helix transcriptional regulator [Sphingobacterium humi]MVZ63800.1 helix-turn-helix domain-containing protein [Sphingobacterium humi]